MRAELFVPLVEPVDRLEERLRIPDVHGDGEAKKAAGFPHPVESRIVHMDERARWTTVAEIEAQRLEDLETLRSRVLGLGNLVRLP